MTAATGYVVHILGIAHSRPQIMFHCDDGDAMLCIELFQERI